MDYDEIESGSTREMLIVEGTRLRGLIEAEQARWAYNHNPEPISETPERLNEEIDALRTQIREAEALAGKRIVGLEPKSKLRWFFGDSNKEYVGPIDTECEGGCRTSLSTASTVTLNNRGLCHLDCYQARFDQLRQEVPTPEAMRAAQGHTRGTLIAENQELRELIWKMKEHAASDNHPRARFPEDLFSLRDFLTVQLSNAQYEANRVTGLEPVDKLRWILGLRPRRYFAPRGAICDRCRKGFRGGERAELHDGSTRHVKCSRWLN